MKKMNLVSRFKNVGVLGFVLAFVVVSIQAQGQARFATVDMKKIFDSYYKTKQAEAQIKDRAAESDKVYKGMVEDYKQLNEDYKKLIDGSNDQALSSD
jgi:outer membrane protein